MIYLIFCLGIVFGCVFEILFTKLTSSFGEVYIYGLEDEEGYDGNIKISDEEYNKLPTRRTLILTVIKGTRTNHASFNGNDEQS